MLNIDATDKIEGIASVADKVEFTCSVVDGTTVKSSEGLLSNSQTQIYLAVAATRILSLTLVNTHTSAVTVNVQKDPTDVGTLYRIIPKDLSLGIGYMLVFDGQRCTVLDASGNLLTSFANFISDATYGAGWNGVTTIAPSKSAVYDEMETKADKGANADITSMTGLDDDGIPGAKVVAATKTTEGVVEIATNTEVVAFTDEARIVTPEGLGYALAGHLAYGIEWDDDESSPTLTRIGALAGIAAGSSPGNACLPIQAKMRRCLVADDGTVNYYLDASDSTKKEDGVTASVLTGTDGQVMVEIPKFYHSYAYNASTHKHQRLISSVQLPGFTLHPAFWKNGAEVDFRYIGAYEGSMYDASLAQMVPAVNIVDNMYAAGDILCSLSGEFPKTNETRAEFRGMADQRGTGWRQLDFNLAFAVQLLFLIEYASFDSQSMIGMGRTELSGSAWAADSYIGQCGKSNGDGNGTNSVGGNTNNAYMTYRGIENFFGNVWKFVDGFNINGGIPYVSNDDTDFADDTATGAGSTYSRLEDINGDGITLSQGSNDYQKNLEQIKNGILPSVLAGSSSTYITDYYYQAAGWRVALLGGVASHALTAGIACWSLGSASVYDSVDVGSRLCR